ncbi:hypothetical protein CEXT_699541 [Caerostris extrusa]|uniref:Uncharacterized protein n=1 Tax=Caerostris extrusa TaxID=172846 RepID=A0AAV4TNJ9_CAEEX|nr:hypothetical protein CEXT_699541 [Caerostris extrusa]
MQLAEMLRDERWEKQTLRLQIRLGRKPPSLIQSSSHECKACDGFSKALKDVCRETDEMNADKRDFVGRKAECFT